MILAPSTQPPANAFVLRMSHGRDRVGEAIESGQIMLGWSRAKGLLATDDWSQFREILKQTHHASETDYRRAGAAAGHAWRFIKEMVPGSWVVVPRGSAFLVAEVTGPATYDETKVDDDSSYRRPVTWLNEGRAIPRRLARAALLSRLKVQGSTASANDLIADIADCLRHAQDKAKPTFGTDLRACLIENTLTQLRKGRLESYGFERVIAALLRATGGSDVRIVPRKVDKGADVLATFRVAGALQLRVAVQAKHYGASAPVERAVVDQLLAGMTAEQADVGIVATSGVFSDAATEYAAQLSEDGKHIELVDGEQLAAMIVDSGLGAVEF